MFDPSTLGINIYTFQIMKGIAAATGPVLNPVMNAIADSFYVVLPLLLIYLYLRKDTAIYAYIFTVVLLFVIGYGIKQIVQEPRPCAVASLSWINNPYGCESGYSFPSDHAMVLTGLIFFLWKYKWPRVVYAAWFILVLFGRVYLGVHYITDVAVGAVLSIIIAYVAYRYKDSIYGLAKRLHLAILTPG